MKTATFKTAKQVAKEINAIASAYAKVFDMPLIENDMNIVVEHHIIAYAEVMKTEGKFSYKEKYYIRTNGVESSKQSIDTCLKYGDKLLAVVIVEFIKDLNQYLVTVQREF